METLPEEAAKFVGANLSGAKVTAAGCLGIKRVGKLLAEFRREKLGEFVFETFAILVGERQIVRIGADAQDIGIDEFEALIRRTASLAK